MSCKAGLDTLLDLTVLEKLLKEEEGFEVLFKVKDGFDAEGNPVYVIRSQNVTSVNSPDELKRKI